MSDFVFDYKKSQIHNRTKKILKPFISSATVYTEKCYCKTVYVGKSAKRNKLTFC